MIAALTPYVGRVPEHETFAGLCQELAWLVETGPSDPAVAETVRALPRVPLSAAAIRDFCWRAAALLPEIRKGRPARPWTGQPRAEWMAFELIEGATARTRRDRPAWQYRCRVIAGSACPDVIPVLWSWGQAARVARELGFTRRGRKRRPYGHGLELARLRFAAQVLPALSLERPGFDLASLYVPGPFRQWNIGILNARVRREPPCPQSFSWPCMRCPIGYERGPIVCPAAVHPATWRLALCAGCRRESFFNPDAPGSRCIECAAHSS